MWIMGKKSGEKNVRVSLYVPEEIDRFIRASCIRVITVKGEQLRLTKTLNEAYLEFIKKGILSLEDDEKEDKEE